MAILTNEDKDGLTEAEITALEEDDEGLDELKPAEESEAEEAAAKAKEAEAEAKEKVEADAKQEDVIAWEDGSKILCLECGDLGEAKPLTRDDFDETDIVICDDCGGRIL